MSDHVLTARWLLPIAGPPLEGGSITVSKGAIASIDPARTRSADEDLGDMAILPGLVNPHTHLDLSGLRGVPMPAGDFVAWLRAVIEFRGSRTPDRVREDIRSGLAEAVRFGTTLIGDIAAGGASSEILARAAVRSVCFFELIGLTRERAGASYAAAAEWLERFAPGRCLPGLSPHAPYSVSRELFARAAGLARERGLPLAVHVAESPAEAELLADRTGPLADFLRGLGVWEPGELVAGHCDILAASAGAEPLWVHGNYLAPESGGNRVFCPRTHARFGFAPYPLRELLAAGKTVALGTDSLASSPDLDPLAEAALVLDRNPDVGAARVLRMVTLDAAELLGFGGSAGRLEAGLPADLVAVPTAGEGSPYELAVRSRGPRRVMAGGEWLNQVPG